VSSKRTFTGPLLLASTPKKPDASVKVKWRVVIDSRKLNEWRVGDAYPIPNITDTSVQLGKARISLLSILWHHQIQLAARDRPKSDFRNLRSHSDFIHLPMGMKSAPAMLHSLINSVLAGMDRLLCFLYMDDVIIRAGSLKSHNERLRDDEPFKCEFLRAKVQLLVQCVSNKTC